MSFAADTHLGPYQILVLIGSGGMGEVYRARDTRLLREVALKALPESFTSDPDRLRRFEQEARAVAALSHPNIVSVHDVGNANGVHYIVSELLEGETLRQRIPASGMPARKAVELAVQLAHGLAAAHEKGIVHRDLKPENIFVTRDNRIKILDFGLAKLRPQHGLGINESATVADTSIGQVLGTVGYMSPEQVRGEPADHRSDIFSFGSILYEMLSGNRAFKHDTGAETMSAILNEEPAELPKREGGIAPALERIVRHCMEKQPAQRFQSAHDIAFDLESVSSISGTAVTPVKAVAARRWALPALAGVLLLAAGLGLGAWLRPGNPDFRARLHRITFRRGTIWNARFTPEGNLVYSASWDGKPLEVFAEQSGSNESHPLEMKVTSILAVSSTGELAVLRNQRYLEGFEYAGMLARAPQGGGAPRDIIDNVEYADWFPDGTQLAAVRRVAGKVRLEFPLGKVVYETAAWVSHPRISPDGKLIAFIEHPFARDDAGRVAVVDQSGNKRVLSQDYISTQGLAWRSPSEIWFTATPSGSSRELRSVTLEGKERLIYLGTGTLTLYDIYKDGRVLFARDDWRAGMIGLGPGEDKERDLSWHDWTVPRDLTDDGKVVSFDETGEAGGGTGAIYVRGTDGSPAVRLGDGRTATLSPDGKYVLASGFPRSDWQELPTGAGESKTISTGQVQVQSAYFFPDRRRILFVGSNTAGGGQRLWVYDPQQGAPRPISPEGAIARYRSCISPDGTRVAARDPQGTLTIYSVADGSATPVPTSEIGDEPVHWTADGKGVVVGRSEIPVRVFIIDLASGKRTLFKTFTSVDPTGLVDNAPPHFSRDLKSYIYAYTRITSDLYIVEGLK